MATATDTSVTDVFFEQSCGCVLDPLTFMLVSPCMEAINLRHQMQALDIPALVARGEEFLNTHEANEWFAHFDETRRLRPYCLAGPPLLGEIKVGDQLVWEPFLINAREHVTVEELQRNEDDELWIKLANSSGSHWNDESRTREACGRRVLRDQSSSG